MNSRAPANILIAPSILSADFFRLGEQVKEALEAGARRIHVDVMDGHFVPHLSMGPQVVQALRPLADRFNAQIYTHLMITGPDRFLAEFTHAGSDALIVHLEACPHLHHTVRSIRSLGVLPGVALNPATPLMMLEDVLADVDNVLVMSVDPGSGGQEFIPASLAKISRLRRLLAERGLDHVEIAVDGGINPQTAANATEAGAAMLVAGSAVFNAAASIADNMQALSAAIRQQKTTRIKATAVNPKD
jgi:ribulose-phosphate 3-epimerase